MAQDSPPQFSHPFRVTAGSVATVEQDSLEEIEQCVEAILRTPVGTRIDAPEFGRPEELFSQLGPNPSVADYLTAIERFEPRALELGEAKVEEMVKRIVISPAAAQ